MKTQIPCQKIISGGQTGADRGALIACLDFGFPCGGWCPANRNAVDGQIDSKYPLKETVEVNYLSKTKIIIVDSDDTLKKLRTSHKQTRLV